jgi:diguanylate cyclase (GGDEF)-like protein
MFGTFKTRLAVYFLLLAVLPLGAAFWGFVSVARNAELQRVDARLGAELRAVHAAYSRRLQAGDEEARRVAGLPELHQALRDRDLDALRRLVRGRSVRVEAPGLTVGPGSKLDAGARVHVRDAAGRLGDVVAVVPLDGPALKLLSASAGIAPGDRIALLPATTVGGGAETLRYRGGKYRAVAGGSLPGRQAQLTALAPYAAIQTDSSAAVRRLLIALLVSLGGVALVAALEGRSILRSIREFTAAAQSVGAGRLDGRVPVRGGDEIARLARTFNAMADQLQARLEELSAERRRLRDSIARMGEALAATHDQDALLRVIAEAARDATNASGAIVVTESAVVEVGEIGDSADELEVQLTVNDGVVGTIALYGEGFDEESTAAAQSFAAHAAVALENADLHRIVELQAIEDALTGLPNRRRCEEFLVLEVARSERYETELSIALCDLDRFKAINDRHGHAVGDLVLKEAAACLRHELRDLDLVGRWGGEEFVLVLPHTGSAGAVVTIERIREALSRRTVPASDGAAIAVTGSFGVAELRPGMSVAALLQAADEALYAAKAAGRNRVSTGALTAASESS